MKPRPEAARGGTRAITSLQNERVKLIRSLNMRKSRRETGLFVAEGASVLVAARDAGWKPTILVFLAGSAAAGVAHELLAWAQAAGAECLEVSQAVLGKLAAKENPQTMLAVFEQRWHDLPAPPAAATDALWVVLEAARDPGNLGTIIRTVDAVGASGVVLIGSTVDPYAREAVRATMGSIFSVPLVRADAGGGPRRGWRAGRAMWSAPVSTRATISAPQPIVRRRSCSWAAKGRGCRLDLTAVCTRLVRIPMAGRLDSLNLAVATALMLYEMRKGQL